MEIEKLKEGDWLLANGKMVWFKNFKDGKVTYQKGLDTITAPIIPGKFFKDNKDLSKKKKIEKKRETRKADRYSDRYNRKKENG